VFLATAWLMSPTVGAAQSSAAPAAASHKAKAKTKKTAPAVEVPQTTAAPPTLEQQSPIAPQVTYSNGLLTIASTNATLSQVLHSVQAQTGATIEIPPGGGSERVVATLGPGKPQVVLASLLNGSKFNYVILGEADNPGAVKKVILLAKSGGSSGQTPDMTAQNNSRAQQLQPQQAVEPPDDEYPQNEPEVENQNQPVPGQAGIPGAENLMPDNANQPTRTPEQMLQELQRMQQQQQQMQQQLNPVNQQQNQAPGTPFPSPTPSPQPQ
jgi:hypothetical protein